MNFYEYTYSQLTAQEIFKKAKENDAFLQSISTDPKRATKKFCKEFKQIIPYWGEIQTAYGKIKISRNFFFSEQFYTKDFLKIFQDEDAYYTKMAYKNFIGFKRNNPFRPLATLSKIEFNLFIGEIQKELGIIEED